MKKIKNILAISGACISFYIGAGYSTMQEVIQYEASYGSLFYIPIIVAALIYIYTNISFAVNSSRLGLTRGGQIFEKYFSCFGGEIATIGGAIFDWFSALFCFMCYIVMCGGANSVFSQQYDLQQGAGSLILCALVIVTVVFGLDYIVKKLSKYSVIIIGFILLVSMTSVFCSSNNYLSNINQIDLGYYANIITQIGNGNPLISGLSYGGFVILWFAAFIAEISNKNKLNNVTKGIVLSAIFIFLTSAFCCFSLICNISDIASADIPALVLANNISPLFSLLFSAIIFIGIFTTAVPLLWTWIRKLSNEKTVKYKALTIVFAIAGCLIACFIPYKGLINIFYGINGYIAFPFVIVMIIYDIRTKMSKTEIKKK